MLNSDFWTRITSLYGSQTWPVVLCKYSSVLSIRITSLYGSQPSSVVFERKTATFGPELQVSKVQDLTCRFVHAIERNNHQNYCVYGSHPLSVAFAFKTTSFGAELQVSIGPRPHLSLCACKTAWFDSESLVSIVPSPHLWVLDANQRHSDQNN